MNKAAGRGHGATGAAPPNNLPRHLTSFIGRKEDLQALTSLLTDARLITLTGSGGAGKSRLAVALASAGLNLRPDGAWWVELAPLTDPDQLPGAVVAAIQLDRQSSASDVLTAWLTAKRALLVLDNCEHLIRSCADFCEVALKQHPELTIIATSREALGIPGEVRWPVTPMRASDAARLFGERGRLANPTFKVGSSNLKVVTELCERLDGLPLAIELAAARLDMMRVDEILSRLGDRFELLSGGSRTAPSRQVTMRATIDWSHGLLADNESTLFRRLSVFRGGFTVESAQAVCGDGLAPVLNLLAALVQKSMVEVEGTRDGATRYRLLESMRAYAEEQLLGAGETEPTLRKQYVYFLATASNALHPLDGRNWMTTSGLAWMRREWDNLHAALRWARGNAPDLGLSLAAEMTWSPYCDLEEARSLLRDLLAHSPAAGLSRARALHRAGGVEGQLGAHKEAVTLFESSVDLLRRLDAPNDLAYALFFLGQAHNMLGRFDAATEALGGAASLAEEIGNRTLAMGISAAVGEMAVQRGDYAAGRDILTECVAYFRSAGDAYYMTGWLPTLAHAQMRLNDDAAASASLHESLRLSRDFNDRRNAVWCLMGFSRLAAAKGDHRRSIRLRAAAEHLARELAMSLDEWWLGELPPTTNHRSPAWNQGTAMTMDHAVAYALGDSTTLVTKPLLSIRERSVAGMVAQGQSNRLIAERLHISERTAESHLEHIRNKLGFHSRSQVATWATEEGLVSTAS